MLSVLLALWKSYCSLNKNADKVFSNFYFYIFFYLMMLNICVFQTRPLISLQSEHEQDTGRKILTCYLLPQGPPQDSGMTWITGVRCKCIFWICILFFEQFIGFYFLIQVYNYTEIISLRILLVMVNLILDFYLCVLTTYYDKCRPLIQLWWFLWIILY